MTAMEILERVRGYPDQLELLEVQLKLSEDAVANGANSPEMLEEVEDIAHSILELNRKHAAELEAVARMLKLLPATTAKVMNRYYVKGQSYGLISDKMTFSTSYIRKQVAKGRKALAGLKHAEVVAMLPDWYMEEDEI